MKYTETQKANLSIFIATIIAIIYLITIVYPFFVTNAPPDENSDTWAYALAPLHYILILLPVILGYAFVIAKNILKVRFIRCLLFPACYITFYCMVFMGSFIISSAIFWLFIFTLLPNAILLLAIEIFAIIRDIFDFTKKGDTNANDKSTKVLQKIIDIILYFVLIPILLFSIYYAGTESNYSSRESANKCNNFNNALQYLAQNIDIKSSKNIEDLTEEYTNEFNKESYRTFFGDYDSVKTEVGEYEQSITNVLGTNEVSTVKWINFNFYNNEKNIYSFGFKMNDNCSKSCTWNLYDKSGNCSFKQNDAGKIIADKRTKSYIKYNRK